MAQPGDACSSGNVSDNQNVQEVLQYYLNLFQNDFSSNILDSFAPNCIIDWFGVSIRKEQKLKEFLRYEIKAQLLHTDFNEVTKCEPIEEKPLHTTTKSITTAYTKKPCLDSDTEDDDDSYAVQHMEISPSDTANLGIAPLSKDESGAVLKRSKSTKSQIDSKKCKTANEEQIDSNYSPLQYLEARGRLESLTSRDCDRNVRLAISYRKHLTNNNVQFALIIYERLQPNGEPQKMPRRKLNFDVHEAADEFIDEQESLESALTRPTTPLNATTEIVEESANLSAFLALRTPTKVSTSPPATPRRRRRDMSSQNLKRSYTAGPSYMSTDPETPKKPTKKCNAARTLRL